jgi:hypothetical protein
MSVSYTQLKQIISEWQRWAASADQSEDGWQSSFPDWKEMMRLAAAIMCRAALDEETFRLLEFCWEISEEDETMADHAKDCGEKCRPVLRRLARSRASTVRWQVFDVVGSLEKPEINLLVAGLNDADAYCRRRALLALARADHLEAKKQAIRFTNDSDPQTKRIARELLGDKASQPRQRGSGR